jgi:hypothetical protein
LKGGFFALFCVKDCSKVPCTAKSLTETIRKF